MFSGEGSQRFHTVMMFIGLLNNAYYEIVISTSLGEKMVRTC